MNRVRNLLNIDRLHEQGITGKGVGIAILDTGVYSHTDLSGNIALFRDMINDRVSLYDDNGHGTHVAGIAVSKGTGSGGKYKGIAPDAHIVMIKCLNYRGNGKTPIAIRALDFIKKNREKYNIRIINISVGSDYEKNDKENEALIEAVEDMWKRGFVVVAAAGNNGPVGGTITIPGCAKSIITVGAADDDQEVKIRGQKSMIHYSGRGPTDICIVKPEIVAPGTGIMSCSNGRQLYSSQSGTSMATPVVAGSIALMLEKNPSLTNKEIKRRIFETAVDLGYDKNHQGWGMIHPEGLIAETVINE